MHVVWNKSLPTGAVRRYSPNELSIPVNNDQLRFVSVHRRTTLVRADGWLAGYLDGELVGVVRERCTAASHAPNAVAFFGLADGDGTELMRWDLADQILEPLVRLPHRIHWLGSNDDATSLVVVNQNVVSLYDGRGAVRWTRDLGKQPSDDDDEDEKTWFGPIKNAVVEGDVVTLYWHLEDEDYPEVYASARLAPDQAIERLKSGTWPPWYRDRASRQSIYRLRALGDVAISRDGTQVATARNAWTRPEGVLLKVPEIYDSGMSSSWGGEASVIGLAYTDDGELIRLSARNATWILDRCTTGGCETPTVESARLLPGTDRLITIRNGTIALGDRVLMEASREARVSCADDGSVIAIQLGRAMTIFDPSGNVLRTFDAPAGLWGVGPNGTAVTCHQGSGFVVAFATGEVSDAHASETPPAFSPDGTHVAFGYDWRLKIHNLATKKTVRTEELVSPVVGVAFSRDGVLFTGTADGGVTEWDLEMP